MNMSIDKKGFTTILENYYMNHDELGITAVDFKVVNHRINHRDNFETVVYKKTKKKLLGEEIEYERTVEHDEIKRILNEVFEPEGVLFENFTLVSDEEEPVNGYVDEVRTFKGIEARVDFIKGFQKRI